MRLRLWVWAFLLLGIGAVAQIRSSAKPKVEEQQKFSAEMEKIRDAWVEEFNAGR